METQLNTLEGCQREMVIRLTRSELEPYFAEAYKKVAPEIELPGFRKGKAPIAMIKQRMGKQIENDSLDEVANQIFNETVNSNDIKPIGQPSLADLQRDSEGGVTFTIKYEVVPDFELQDYRGIELKKPVVNITDEDTDVEIHRLCTERGTLVEAEQVSGDDFIVSIEIRKIDAELGMPLIGQKPEVLEVFMGSHDLLPDLKASLLNTKIGDTFNHSFAVRHDHEHDHDHDGLDHAHKKATTRVTVSKIQEIMPADFSNEFVEELTQGRFVSTEEFREFVKKDMQRSTNEQAQKIISDMIVSKIIEKHNFPVPHGLVTEIFKSFVAELVEQTEDKKLPPNFDSKAYTERMWPVAQNTAKWVIIRDKIVDQEGLKVEEEDIRKAAEPLLAVTGMGIDQLIEFITEDEQMNDKILMDKIIDVLLGYAVITEVDVKTALAHEAENLNA